MEIQELYLKHYGKFENHRISLKPGVNIIYGGNESGKSTIHSFICAMFFGLSRGRGKAAKKDGYQLRRPWENPGYFAGSMTVREGQKRYRIDRNFDSRAADLGMVCVTDGVELKDPQKGIEVLLGNLSESAFLNTVFISQGGSGTDESLILELRQCMVNGGSGQDLGLDVNGALASLRKKKKQAEQKKKREEEALEGQIDRKQAEADYLRREKEMLKDQLTLEEQRTARSGEVGEPPLSRKGRMALEILLVLAGVLALLGAALLPGAQVKAFLGIFGAVFLLLTLPVHFLAGRVRESGEEPPDSPEAARLAYLQEEIRKREDSYHRLQEEMESLYQEHMRLEASETELAALDLAIDRICALTEGIYEKSGGGMNRRASQILKEITQGRYERIVMDDTGEIRIHTADRVLGLYQLSYGTVQQIYFAVRMAAGELFSPDRRLPVVLDEPFALYDDARLKETLSWLMKSGRQVILFTCQKREREILEELRRSGG